MDSTPFGGGLGANDLVAILNTGATGFAVVMLFISYRLIAGAQKMIFDRDPHQFTNAESFRTWNELVHLQVRQTRSFMILAAVFFFGGLAALFYQYRAESDIILVMRPYEQPFPQIFVQGQEHQFKDSGHAPLRVHADGWVELRAEGLYDRMEELEDELERVKLSLQATTAQTARESSEFGL